MANVIEEMNGKVDQKLNKAFKSALPFDQDKNAHFWISTNKENEIFVVPIFLKNQTRRCTVNVRCAIKTCLFKVKKRQRIQWIFDTKILSLCLVIRGCFDMRCVG